MRLNRLYSNKPEFFAPIVFNDGFSAIIAEIRVPENQKLATHNLGKSTVGDLIDFCLLKGKRSSFFLFKHSGLFSGFVFFLELTLPDSGYLTIRRAVSPGSRVDLLTSDAPLDDASVDEVDWDHTNLTLDQAKLVLDGLLGVDALKPWGLRQLVGYLIRSQADYQDVFQLDKHAGKYREWKPFMAHLLGLDAAHVVELYDKREEIDQAEKHLSSLLAEWGDSEVEPSVISGLVALKRREVQEKSAILDAFAFGAEDAEQVRELVEDTERNIAGLNERAYRLAQLASRLEESLAEQQVIFRIEDAEELFQQAGVAFGDQIKKDYDQLVAFNRAISSERREILLEQLRDSNSELASVTTQLTGLNLERSRALGFLRETDSLEKYKALSRELTTLAAELQVLEARRAAVARVVELRQRNRALSEDFNRVKSVVESEIVDLSDDDDSTLGRIRQYFSEIIYETLGQKAVLAIDMNGAGGLDFVAEFIDSSGTATSGGRGTTYRKLMCIAFDLAVLRSYGDVTFPRFVYHDGAFEQLERRTRQNLLGVFREYSNYGLQPIVSLLDLELPESANDDAAGIVDDDVVVRLHDEGEDGRLFKFDSW